MSEYEEGLLEELERDLEDYDRIFLIPVMDEVYGELFRWLERSGTPQNCGKKILVLSVEALEEGNRYSCRRISVPKMAWLKELYFMYEFSDRFRLLSREEGFGGILNFLDTGILTKEEVFRGLLY